MTEQSTLAKLGLRLGTLGTSSTLAIAAPVTEGSLSPTASTVSSRIGFFFDRTAASEHIGLVVMGTVTARFQQTIAYVDTAAEVSGQFRVGDGTVSLPGLAFISDADTGLYNISANTLGIATAGALIATVSANSLTVGNDTKAVTTNLQINTAAGTERDINFLTAGVSRIVFRCSSTAEAGSNSGSNLQIIMRDDAGAAVESSVFHIRRAAGEPMLLCEAGGRPIVMGTTAAIATERCLISGGGALPTPSATQVVISAGGIVTGAGITAGALVLTLASAVGGAGFRLPPGAAPTSPVNGDLWTTTAGLFARINGSTVGPYGAGATPAGSDTQVQFNDAGAFAGNAAFTFVKATGLLTVTSHVLTSTTDASSTTTGSFTTLGGMSYGAAKTLYGGNANFAGTLTVGGATVLTATTDATTTTTGSFTTLGGMSYGTTKALYGGSIHLAAGTVSLPSYSLDGDTDTGIYAVGANSLGTATNGVLRLTIDTAAVTSTLPFLAPAGTGAAPSLSFSGDYDTGLFSLAGNQLGITVGGTNRATVTTTAFTSTLLMLGPAGTVGGPAYSYSGDSNTGLYSVGADSLGIATGGVLRVTIDTASVTSTLPFYSAAGAAATPAYSYSGDTNTGTFSVGADSWGIATGGVLRVTVDTASVTSTLPFLAPAGSAAAPSISFSGDTNTGFASLFADQIAFCVGGSAVVTLSTGAFVNTLQYWGVSSTAAAPLYAFSAASDPGIYLPAAGTVGVSTSGTLRLSISTTTLTSTLIGIFPATTTSAASLRIPHGTAPTSPVNGDLWTTTAGLFAQINGSTVGPYAIAGAGTIGGSIAVNQIAVGTASNTIGGASTLTATTTTGALLVSYAAGTSTATAATNVYDISATSTGTIAGCGTIFALQNSLLTVTPGASVCASVYANSNDALTVTSAANNNLGTASIFMDRKALTFQNAATSGAGVGSLYGLDSQISVIMAQTSGTVTVGNVYGLSIRAGTFSTAAGGTTTVINYYGMFLATVTTSGSGTTTITNRYGIYQADTAALNYFGGNLALGAVGSGLLIKEGTNATSGVATLSSGTVVVSTTKVTANSRIQLTPQSLGTITIPVGLAVTTRNAGSDFTILSGNLADTSVVAWVIIEPAV